MTVASGTLFSIALSAAAGTAARKRLPIAMLGVRYKGSQKIEITRAMLAQVVANFRKRDTGDVHIDYEHASEEPEVARGGAVPAAGWIKAMDDAPDAQGILWGDVEWTAKAAALIAAREYKYISPFIDPTVRDNRTGEPQGWTLTSAALTNRPVLQGMPALVLSERGWQEVGRGDSADKGFRVQQALGEAVRAGAILPWQRAAFEKMALSDPARVLSLLESMARSGESGEEMGGGGKVNINEHAMGYADRDWSAVQLEINRRVEQMMAGDPRLTWAAATEAVMAADPSLVRKAYDETQVEITKRVKLVMAGNGSLDYARALQAVMVGDPSLFRRWRELSRQTVGSPGVKPVKDSRSVDIEIQSAVQAKMALSDGKMSGHDAFALVLRERPDLARRKKESMG